jgi:tetratricopeptide (TPR) repeat protein
MKELFPYQSASDDVAAEAWLECGEPDQAALILAETRGEPADPERRAALRKRIEQQTAGARAALPFARDGYAHLQGGRVDLAVNAFELACRSHPYDPYLRADLAFSLRRAGDPKSAASLLMSLVRIIPIQYLPAVYFNTGLALLQSGEEALARQMLTDVAGLIGAHLQEPVSEMDLPGPAVAITEEGALVEEQLAIAYELLRPLAEHDGDPALAWLLRQYAPALL